MALQSPELLESLPSLVRSKYHAAKARNALTLAFTHLAIVSVHGVPVRLRASSKIFNKDMVSSHVAPVPA